LKLSIKRDETPRCESVFTFAQRLQFDAATGYAPYVLSTDLRKGFDNHLPYSRHPVRSISLAYDSSVFFNDDLMSAFYVSNKDFQNWYTVLFVVQRYFFPILSRVFFQGSIAEPSVESTRAGVGGGRHDDGDKMHVLTNLARTLPVVWRDEFEFRERRPAHGVRPHLLRASYVSVLIGSSDARSIPSFVV
jgi:hypothetical protein